MLHLLAYFALALNACLLFYNVYNKEAEGATRRIVVNSLGVLLGLATVAMIGF
jgi:hypothetical protein